MRADSRDEIGDAASPRADFGPRGPEVDAGEYELLERLLTLSLRLLADVLRLLGLLLRLLGAVFADLERGAGHAEIDSRP